MVSHWYPSIYSVCLSVRILFPDDNLSKCRWIFTKLGLCIDIVAVWFRSANGQISSIFDRLICPQHVHVLDDNTDFTKLGTCRSGLGLLMGNFPQFLLEFSDQETSVFLFQDNNLSKSQWIFIYLGIFLCIDIVEIWFGIANGQISTIFDKVFCSQHDNDGVLSFTRFYFYLFFILIILAIIIVCIFFIPFQCQSHIWISELNCALPYKNQISSRKKSGSVLSAAVLFKDTLDVWLIEI